MIVSLRWLRQLLNFKIEVDEVLDALTNAGLEIEWTRDLGVKSGLILVGEVLSVDRHPEADKLTVCKVDVGRAEPLNIVCGATNHKVGDKVPLALTGAELPNGVKLKRAKIRGIESEGMMCSAVELDWSDDASGILILPPEWKVGEPFDFIFDVFITPNRPDCMSMLGIARELAAIRRKKIYPSAGRFPEQSENIERSLSVSLQDREGCSRYCARMLRNVSVGPSPLWLVRALESVGLRSINNVVDVTNYVLMEFGHPLHAFDGEKLEGRQIVVRSAKAGEKLETLDGTKIDLDEDDLVIADGERAVALAGVMGGANSEVTESTNTVVLEAAHFDPVRVRRTAKRHGYTTDASQRFERGTDCNILPLAINRAAQLIHQLAEGEVAKGTIDSQSTIADTISPVCLRLSRVKRILGIDILHTEIADMLVHLGCEIPRADREQFFVQPPSWRVDLIQEIDLIEEIARLHGYSKIDPSVPAIVGNPLLRPALDPITQPIACELIAEGFREVVNFSFMAEDLLVRAGEKPESLVRIVNPLTRDHGVMRTSLLHSLLQNTAYNINRGVADIRLFEIGAAFALQSGAPAEWPELGAVICGSTPQQWTAPAQEHDFFTIKGVAERLLLALGINRWQVRPLSDPRFHPKRAATLNQGPNVILSLGELHPDFLESHGIERRACAIEMKLNPLIGRAGKANTHAEISRHPAVDRDLALVVDESVAVGDIEETIRKTVDTNLLESIRLFDVYRGEHIETGKKSLAFALTLRALDRTLQEDEVQKIIEGLLKALEKKHRAVLRG